MPRPTITYLSDIYFEAGAIDVLPCLTKKLGMTRPLLVTDKGVVEAGLRDRVSVDPLVVFDGVEPNPSETCVLNALARYREQGCDGVVGMGGGSPLDCAKCVALLVKHPGPLDMYAYIHGGFSKITGQRPPLMAIPTTAGTGSEVGRAALITFGWGEKLALIGSHLIPDAVVCDPALTLELPPRLTAGTGMDAVSHCVETYCSPQFNPVADAIALDGLERACANIQKAVQDGRDPEARRQMMMAALQGGLTFQKGLGAIHSLSHPLGALEGKPLHHGTLNAVFLPHVLAFNMVACPGRMDQIAGAAGARDRRELPQIFTHLAEQIGLPICLRDLGLKPQDLEPLAERAFKDHCSATNPRPLTVEDCGALYRAAY